MVRLRSFELSDLDEIMKHWNVRDLRQLLGSIDRGAVSSHEEEEWIRNTWKRRQEREAFTMAIEDIAKGKLIGGLGIFNIDWTSRSAEIGISIHNPKYWGKGYGKEALSLLIEFAFRDLNFNRLGLEVFEFNLRAKKCYINVGFQEVGRWRKKKYINGKYHDSILMDILKNEWKKHLTNRSRIGK
ncbi:MAG: GNAT family N-acetyltransferase [Candidatus Bathyarchaeota archaeon]|nr:MAG: GNAT family N-acetyltransferase [Candidatus Bathyarchaeota archaeon]